LASLTLMTLPIGNYADITQRALAALKDGEYFLAEDTRVFKDVLRFYKISFKEKIIESFHDQSDDHKFIKIFHWLEQGKEVFLVSDAGSPLISDPAYPLIRKILEQGHSLRGLPGVNSVTSALELSGLPPHPHTFHGFLPREEEKKKLLLQGLSKGTHLFFESPQRVEKSLWQMSEWTPLYEISVCRELTKTYESVYRFKASEFLSIKEQMVFKGEFVIVVYCPLQNNLKYTQLEKLTRDYMAKSTPKKLAKIFSEILGTPSKEIYNLLGAGRK